MDLGEYDGLGGDIAVELGEYDGLEGIFQWSWVHVLG